LTTMKRRRHACYFGGRVVFGADICYNIPPKTLEVRVKDISCAYCAGGDLLDKFAIRICELRASVVYLFKEQSHLGRVIVASKQHVSEIIDLPLRERQAFMEDVAAVSAALHRVFNPKKVNYGAYGDTGGHLHFHLVPKYENDDFEWGGVFAMDPKRKYLTPDEYGELVAKIGARLVIGDGRDLRKRFVALREEIVKDGKLDLQESAILLKALEPFESSGKTVRDFVAALRRVREDGIVTPEESCLVLKLLDGLLA